MSYWNDMGKIVVWGVYSIRNIKNNKRYIGQSRGDKGIYGRWDAHLSSLKNNKHNRRLQKSWNKHGEASFIFEIVQQVDKTISIDELDKLEQHYTDLYNSAGKGGYSVRKICNSNKGIECTAEIRKKRSVALLVAKKNVAKKCLLYDESGLFIKYFEGISECARYLDVCHGSIMKGIKKRLGWCKKNSFIVKLYVDDKYPLQIDPVKHEIYSKETCNKLGKMRKAKNRICSDETKRKIGIKHKGKIVSIEARLKSSLSHKGLLSGASKSILKININGQIVEEYKTKQETYQSNGFRPVERSLNTGTYTKDGFLFVYKLKNQKAA